MLDALWLFFLTLAAVPRPLKAFDREAVHLHERPLRSRKCRKIGSKGAPQLPLRGTDWTWAQ